MLNDLRSRLRPNLTIERYALSLFPALYLPLREMSIGTSPNLLANGGFEDGITGWNAARSILASETTIVHSGAKSLKVTTNGKWVQANQSFFNSGKCNGITATLKMWGYYLDTNTFKPAQLNIQDYDGSTYVNSEVFFTTPEIWEFKTTSKRIRSTATNCVAIFAPCSSATEDFDDVSYCDDGILTVPQSITPNGLICHPEGCIWTPEGFYFDGIDDLITFESDFIGTSACTIMGWIKPTGTGGGSAGRIVDNGILRFYYDGAFKFYGDGTNFAVSGNYSANQWLHAAVTRTADGTANLVINGQPSGSADQASGTPAAGTTNVVIGNRLAGDRSFAGTIDELLETNKVLSPMDIRTHYQLTRWRYQ